MTPVYATRRPLGWRRAAEDAEAWIDAQMASLGGLERLEHLAVEVDDSAPGVASCLAAIRALGGAETPKVARLTLDNATSASFRACRVQGVAVDAVAMPARVALTSVAARLVAEAPRKGGRRRDGCVARRISLGKIPRRATPHAHRPLRGTPAFEAMREIEASPGGWEAHQALLRALAATGLGVETAMLEGSRTKACGSSWETTLERGPAFDAEKIVGGESLAPTHKEAIDAALEGLSAPEPRREEKRREKEEKRREGRGVASARRLDSHAGVVFASRVCVGIIASRLVRPRGSSFSRPPRPGGRASPRAQLTYPSSYQSSPTLSDIFSSRRPVRPRRLRDEPVEHGPVANSAHESTPSARRARRREPRSGWSPRAPPRRGRRSPR